MNNKDILKQTTCILFSGCDAALGIKGGYEKGCEERVELALNERNKRKTTD